MIYFIEAIGAGLVKIGFTERSVSDRLRELQTASPHRLRIAATVDGGLKEESRLHARFAHLAETGEWFRFGPEIHAAIAFADLWDHYWHHKVATMVDTEEGPIEGTMWQFVCSIERRVLDIEKALGRLGWAFQGCALTAPDAELDDRIRRAVLNEFRSAADIEQFLNSTRGRE